MTESSLKGLKTLWEKEKLLVTSNFSFSHSVFKRLLPQTCENQGLFGKGLICLWDPLYQANLRYSWIKISVLSNNHASVS